MKKYESGVHIVDDFLNKDFNKILKRIIKLPVVQEIETPGGSKNVYTLHNILPCHKTQNFDEVEPILHRYFRKKLQKFFNTPFTTFNCFYRKVDNGYMKDSLQTKDVRSTNYPLGTGMLHKDQYLTKKQFDGERTERPFGSVLYINTNDKEGTLFFKDNKNPIPEETVYAKKDRLLIFQGDRWHAPLHDFNKRYRVVVVFFYGLSETLINKQKKDILRA